MVPTPKNSLNWPQVRVVPFSVTECPQSPRSGPPLFSWREFYSLRNALLLVLNRYGTTGPMAEVPILGTWELSENAWKRGAHKPDFFVVDDMYNEWDRWHRIEASPSLVNDDLLSELVALLLSWPDWCLYIALTVGGLTVFRDRILYEGKTFDGSGSIADLAARCGSTGRTA
jgi:hypothetical protein